MELVVRSALSQEEEPVASLWRACDLLSQTKDPIADFRFAKEATDSDVLVGIDEAGQVKATAMVGHDGHRGWLYYVAADPAARGQGLGGRMVRAAEDWLRQRGVGKAQLLVLESNLKVIAFYEHLGFEVTPRVLMSKFLK
jgi:ribosomal protein S18 acetylase RimI-like enzyme